MGTIGIARAPAGLAGMLALAAACGSVGNKAPDAAVASDAASDSPAGPDAALAWSPLAEVAVNYADAVRTPVVSEDGLTIYFLAQVPGGTFDFDIYSASRASTSDGFGVATAVLNVNVAGQQARYPELSADGLELYFSGNDNGPIMVATRSNVSSAFGAPAAVRAGVAGNFASISGNKLALYYLAAVTPMTSMANAMVMVTTRAAVGQPWSAPAMVALDGEIEMYSSIDISSDELAILRAPTLALPGHNILISRRASKTAAFDQTEVLQQTIDGSVAFASARWSAHDTEIWIDQSAGTTVERPFVSRLR